MNIYLTGLPGCGKSTVAAAYANKSGCRLIDTDDEIERREKMTIAELFRLKSEPYFRSAETAALRETCQYTDAIIATGGGSVLSTENMAIMRENGVIVLLQRPLELILQTLDMKKRPLAFDQKAFFRLAEERRALYIARCDHRVENVGTPEEAVQALMYLLKEIL